MSKKYASLSTLQTFLDNLKNTFSSVSHKHTISDITDYRVDTSLSSTSVNPVQNKVLDEEFNAIADSMNALEQAIDGKASSTHDHNSLYYGKSEIDTKLSAKSDTTHNHDSSYDTKGSSSSALTEAKSYTDTKTSGLASTSTVDTKISTHNTSTSAHNDIRDLINGLTTRLNTLADSDDTTLDQLSEIVAYIKANKSLIDSITTSKVNVSDIINNLTTNVSNKPLSAAQGVVIKTLIDELQASIDSIPQSDWNQSDSTQLDYIKNRTHWSISETAILVDEEASLHNGVYYFSTAFPLNIGQTYTVVYDGTTYNCVAFKDSANYNRLTIGASYGDYSTYPFNIFVMSAIYTGIRTGDKSVHTVKVTTVNEAIQQLDEKYIPDTFAKTADVDTTINNVEDALLDKINNKANISDISNGFNVEVVSTMNSSSWDGCVYGADKYVAVNGTSFAYSTDGVSWTFGTLPSSASGVAYGNGMYCTYGYSSDAVCYSTDGINWNTADTGYSSNKFSINFVNGKFFISAGYAILSSSDCVTWSKYEFSESYTLYGMAYGNGTYVYSGYGDTFVSTNGTSWTKIATLSTTENYASIFFIDGKFIAIAHGTTSYGETNKIAYSTDGKNWTYGTLPITAKWVKAKYCNGIIMAAGISGIIYSTDGVNWTTGSLPDGWATIDTMGSGKEFVLFRDSEVAIARQNPYDLVFKPDLSWTQIYDSGEITESINAFANINIKGYKKLRVVVKCVNDGTNSTSKNGAVTFTATNGTTYQFPYWTTMFTNAAYTSGNMATFEINDGWLICPNATRILKSSNFLGTEGGTADNLNNTGSGIMKCTNELSSMMVSALDQDTNYYFLAGSRVMVWGSVI